MTEPPPVFVGFQPSDWFDDFFHVECRFREPPDEPLLRELAAWTARFPMGDVDWRFSGPFALVALHPHRRRERDALSALEDVLVDHASDRLIEAIALNTAEGSDGPRDPVPGPEVNGSVRPVDPALPGYARSELFDALVKQTHDGDDRARLDAFLREAAQQPIRLVDFELGELPEVAPLPPPLRTLKKVHRYAPGVDMYITHLRQGDAGWPDGMCACTGTRIAVRGSRALVSAENTVRGRDTASEVLLVDEKSIRHVYRAADVDGDVGDVAWLDDERAVVASNARVAVVSLASGQELADVQGGGEIAVGAGGRLLVVSGKRVTRLFAFTGAALVPLARYEHSGISVGPVIDDVPTLRVQGRVVVPSGHDEVISEALAQAKKNAKKQATKKTTKKTTKSRGSKKPTLVELPFADRAADATVAAPRPEDLEAITAAGFQLKPQHWRDRMRMRVGDLSLAITQGGVAVRRGDGAPVELKYTSKSGYAGQLSRLDLDETHTQVFATDANVVVSGPVDGETLEPIFSVLGKDPQPGHLIGMAAIGPDEVAALCSKGVVIGRRVGDGWQVGVVKISKPTHFLASARRREVWIATEAKHRQVLVAAEGPKKLAQFTEDANHLGEGDDWQVADPRRELAWTVTRSG